MKRTPKTIVFIVIGVVALALLVFAGFKAVGYNSPAKPTVTQKTEQRKLAQTPSQPSHSSTGSPTPKSSNPPTSQLSNSGPGNVMALFVVVALLAYGASLLATRRHGRSSTQSV